jgi:3-hydroxyacyl-[acyl-carrier-protein] dehydratase
MVPGQAIEAEKTLSSQEELFRDHFPGFPVVPGVLLTEMMAQTCGKCLDAEFRPRGRSMLAQIKSAKFRKWVRPDQLCRIVANVRSNEEAFATAVCSVEVEGVSVATAELMFAFVPEEQFDAKQRDAVLMDYLESEGQDGA